MLKEVPTAAKGPDGYASDWNNMCDLKGEERTVKIFLVILVLFVVCLFSASIGW